MAPKEGHYPRNLKKANARREAANLEKRRQAFEMYKGGANYTDIGTALGTSRQSATRLVKKELETLGQELRSVAEYVFPLELERLNMAVKQAWHIVMMSCRECGGRGTQCLMCRGTGRHYTPELRLKALREMRMGIDQRSKMLGLYAPEKFALTDENGKGVDFSEELRSMSGDDLDRALADFSAGVSAAQTLEAKEPENEQ